MGLQSLLNSAALTALFSLPFSVASAAFSFFRYLKQKNLDILKSLKWTLELYKSFSPLFIISSVFWYPAENNLDAYNLLKVNIYKLRGKKEHTNSQLFPILDLSFHQYFIPQQRKKKKISRSLLLFPHHQNTI